MKRTPFAVFITLLACLWATPALAGFQILGSLTRESRVPAGQQLEGRILVHNSGTEILELEAYQSDYFYSYDGTNKYGAPGSLARSNAAWITLSPRQLRVPAGETLGFSYTVAVPADAGTGSFWSMIMISPLKQPVDEAARPGERKVNVQTVMRYGVQVVTEVGAPEPASVKIVGARLEKKEAGPALIVDMENDGIRHVKPELWLEVFDETGVLLGRFNGDSKRLMPGCSARYTVPLTGLPAGKYSALMVADMGRDEVFGTQYDLDVR